MQALPFPRAAGGLESPSQVLLSGSSGMGVPLERQASAEQLLKELGPGCFGLIMIGLHPAPSSLPPVLHSQAGKSTQLYLEWRVGSGGHSEPGSPGQGKEGEGGTT